MSTPTNILAGILVLSAIGNGYLFMTTQSLKEEVEYHKGETRKTVDRNNSLEKELNATKETLTETQNTLLRTEEARKDLKEEYDDEKERNDLFAEQIEEITGTVGDLDKLAQTDEELLQKYSKVYFLNENYIPEKLVEIEKEYLYDESEPKFIHAKVADFLYKMLEEAQDDALNLWIVSAYRSFDEQAALKGDYLVHYGEGANTFSADQGYSEHQLGTTVDLTTNNLGGGINGFETTPAYEWMLENAYKFGFILSYPHDNEFYEFEPWHWRFVGEELARDLHKDDAHFYDWDQRDIDTYLISIFD